MGVFLGLFKEIASVQKTFCHQRTVHFLSGNSHPAVIMEIHLAGVSWKTRGLLLQGHLKESLERALLPCFTQSKICLFTRTRINGHQGR